tara:strand:+ start:124 stop:498 length:375 start_codon:yes stop_codon:yes gene_type:complete
MWDFSKGYKIYFNKAFKVMVYNKNLNLWNDYKSCHHLLAHDVKFMVDTLTKKLTKHKSFSVHAFVLAKEIEVIDENKAKELETSEYKEAKYSKLLNDNFFNKETNEAVYESPTVILSKGKIKYK